MKFSSQEERLDYLVKELCNDSIKYRDMIVKKSEKRMIMRALMNIRMPKPISKEFLEVQDEFLQEESRKRGVVQLNDIPTLKVQYGLENKYSNKISIWKGDITRLQIDAIVNAANSQMLGCFVPGHMCIDNAIHSFAGLQLRDECNEYMKKMRIKNKYYDEPTGSAVVTKAYNLLCKYVIHTVGPIVMNYLTDDLKNDLRSSYRSCLNKAIENGIKSIAFCCISTGEFHFPNDEAAKIAIDEVTKFLSCYYNKFDRIIFNVFKDYDQEIYCYISDCFGGR